MIVKYIYYLCMLIFAVSTSCSNADFSGGVGQPAAAVKPTDVSLQLNMLFADGSKQLKISAAFAPSVPLTDPNADYHRDYALVPGSVKSDLTGGFDAVLATQLAASTFTAGVDHSAANKDGAYAIKIHMSSTGLIVGGTKIGDKAFDLSQTSAEKRWTKDEGVLKEIPSQGAGGQSGDCEIEPNGAQPKGGVYFVVLTKPAPCDFRMPKVQIKGQKFMGSFGNPVDVLIGTYYRNLQQTANAHPFSVVGDAPKDSTGQIVALDNGFLLVQPDNKSYLLVDGGQARPDDSAYHSTAKVATDLSQTMGFGVTVLLQPSPGSASDNYASGTLFKKGSVIALYDDTPDMGGSIDVKAMTQSNQSAGLTLTWDAQN